MADEIPKPPRKESPGAPKKADRVIEGEVEIDLFETFSVVQNFWVQPSLKRAFTQACQQANISAADHLRDAMLKFVTAHRSKSDASHKPTNQTE